MNKKSFALLGVILIAACSDNPSGTSCTQTVTFPATGLPVLDVNTGCRDITSKTEYVEATFRIVDSLSPENNLEATGGIRGRGNSTWENPKKPYRIKFDEKQSLFGHENARSWVLLANYLDPTLLMNAVAFELASRLQVPFANHSQFVELVLNGTHLGNYLLTEQVQEGEGRVDIDETEVCGETKGWLVELDTYYDEGPKWKTPNYELPAMIKSPEDLPDEACYDFVKQDLNALDIALHSDAFPENGYREMIDMESFVRYFLVYDILGSREIKFPKSVYLHKDKNSPITMGPVWDFDLAFFAVDQEDSHDRWAHFDEGQDNPSQLHPFFKRFFDDPEFATRYKEVFNENLESIHSMVDFIDQEAHKLAASQKANENLWPWLGNESDYESEIATMKQWLQNRIAWISSYLK